MDAFDGVYVEDTGLSSGKIEWREVAVRGRSEQLCNARLGHIFSYKYRRQDRSAPTAYCSFYQLGRGPFHCSE